MSHRFTFGLHGAVGVCWTTSARVFTGATAALAPSQSACVFVFSALCRCEGVFVGGARYRGSRPDATRLRAMISHRVWCRNKVSAKVGGGVAAYQRCWLRNGAGVIARRGLLAKRLRIGTSQPCNIPKVPTTTQAGKGPAGAMWCASVLSEDTQPGLACPRGMCRCNGVQISAAIGRRDRFIPRSSFHLVCRRFEERVDDVTLFDVCLLASF